jgi:DNA-binding response OmpR family regulator
MRVLLIEDDAMIAQGMQTTLRQAGFALDWTGGPHPDCGESLRRRGDTEELPTAQFEAHFAIGDRGIQW